MATMTATPATTSRTAPYHDYHAEAHVLDGKLQRPIEQEIEQQAPVTLNDRRGGHRVRYVEDVSIEGLISFTKGQTRVSGSRSLKNNGWVTLSTSILEGLNVFETITAERIVSQVSTAHPYENGHVPHVTFLGTQFSNFRVSGFPVTLTLNLGICGKRPEPDRLYFDDFNFLDELRKQAEKTVKATGLPKELKDKYDKNLANINELLSTRGNGKPGPKEPKVTCSLVQSIGEIPIPGVQSFGHVLVIPDFGVVSLGEIEVGEKMYADSERPSVYFELTLLKMKLGCIGDATVSGATTALNGHHRP